MAATIQKFEASKVFKKNVSSEKKITVNRGGARSGKTYSQCQMIAIWLLTGQYRKGWSCDTGVFSIVRKTLPSLKSTVKRDFEEVLNSLNVFDKIKINKTDLTYEYNGRMVEMFSVDNQQKVRGRKRWGLFCNEANELNYKSDFYQLFTRTTGAINIDFNPDDPETWIKTEIEEKRFADIGDVDIIVSTYKDNRFLEPELIRNLESLKSDEQFWRAFGLGEYGAISGQVFNNWTVGRFSTTLKKRAFGLDFGFTHDPTALVECGLNGGKLYVKEHIYETHMTNSDIIARFKEIGIKKNDLIIADSAEPKSIKDLKNAGYNVVPANKGKDSIKHTISTLRQYDIIVDSKSTNVISELKRYKYKKINEEYINEPIDMYNHSMDALRYYSENQLSKNNLILL